MLSVEALQIQWTGRYRNPLCLLGNTVLLTNMIIQEWRSSVVGLILSEVLQY